VTYVGVTFMVTVMRLIWKSLPIIQPQPVGPCCQCVKLQEVWRFLCTSI